MAKVQHELALAFFRLVALKVCLLNDSLQSKHYSCIIIELRLILYAKSIWFFAV